MKRKKAFKKFLISLTAQVFSIIAIAVLITSIVITVKGNATIEAYAAEIGVDETLPMKQEQISVKARVNRYINSLPIPEEVTWEEEMAEKIAKTEENQEDIGVQLQEVSEEETQMQEVQETVQVEVNGNNELAKRAEGITPTIRSMNVSAYCACVKCCGKEDGETASQTQVQEWYTVAAGQGYEMGTIIYIPSLSDKPNQGWFVVEDRGGAIDNSKLDLYFATHQAALNFGRHQLECYIYEF